MSIVLECESCVLAFSAVNSSFCATLWFLQLQLTDQDLVGLAAGGRLLIARPYGTRMSHKQGLATCMAAAKVGFVGAQVLHVAGQQQRLD